ncbi:MAG: hypothetical protein H5U13_08015 [Parvibaculum sp.]|nr:hypothetical protein [Parvibaculum sp.]
MAIVEAISGVPDALRGFVYGLVFINTASVFFVFHRAEARWVLAIWAALVLPGMGLAEREIAPRIIAAPTTAFWTPLLVWLIWRNPIKDAREPWGTCLVLLFASNLIAACLAAANLWFHSMPWRIGRLRTKEHRTARLRTRCSLGISG